jgi:hypothetical protein
MVSSKVSVSGAFKIVVIACWNMQRDSPQQYVLMELSAAFQVKNGCDNFATMSENWASTECQWLLALNHAKCKGSAATVSHNRTVGRLSGRKWLRQNRDYVLKMSVNGASINFWPCILNNPRAERRHWSIIQLSATILMKTAFDDIITMPLKRMSMQCDGFQALHLRNSRGYAFTLIENWTISRLAR